MDPIPPEQTQPQQAPPEPKQAKQEQPGWLKLVIDILLTPIDRQVLQTAPELGHLSPVIFTVGSLFLSVITLNYPIFVFSLAAGEATLLHSVLSSTASYFATPSLGPMTEKSMSTNECRSFFQSMTPMRFQAFLKKGISTTFPSTSMYFISFAAAYCLQCITSFNEETSELGPSYSNRAYLSLIAAVMFILLYALYLRTYGCESILTIIASILVGCIVGSFLCYQNYALFGKHGIDLLFIPPLQKRSGMDYICVSTS
jgi:hypothetical protein